MSDVKEPEIITLDQWVEKYRPVFNENGNILALETYGEDAEIIKDLDVHHIWTFINDNDGIYAIIPGWHFVNRLNYTVTLVPWKEPGETEVILGTDQEVEVIDKCDEMIMENENPNDFHNSENTDEKMPSITAKVSTHFDNQAQLQSIVLKWFEESREIHFFSEKDIQISKDAPIIVIPFELMKDIIQKFE